MSGLVYDSWYKIVDKLRAAKLRSPEYDTAMAEPAPVQEPRSACPNRSAVPVTPHETPHMNSISVSQNRRNSGLIVVQPDTQAPPASPAVPSA